MFCRSFGVLQRLPEKERGNAALLMKLSFTVLRYTPCEPRQASKELQSRLQEAQMPCQFPRTKKRGVDVGGEFLVGPTKLLGLRHRDPDMPRCQHALTFTEVECVSAYLNLPILLSCRVPKKQNLRTYKKLYRFW